MREPDDAGDRRHREDGDHRPVQPLQERGHRVRLQAPASFGRDRGWIPNGSSSRDTTGSARATSNGPCPSRPASGSGSSTRCCNGCRPAPMCWSSDAAPATVSSALADGRRYTGVDLSARQLALAREHLPDATFIQGDLTTIELPGRRRSTRSLRSSSSTISRALNTRRRSRAWFRGSAREGVSCSRSAPPTRTTRSRRIGSASRCSSRASSRTRTSAPCVMRGSSWSSRRPGARSSRWARGGHVPLGHRPEARGLSPPA